MIHTQHLSLLLAAALFLAVPPAVQSFSIVLNGRSNVLTSKYVIGGRKGCEIPRRRIVSLRAEEDDDDDEEEKFEADESAPLLVVKNLQATIGEGGKQILNGIDLQVDKGEIHAIMGTNGSGKSTLSKVLVGFPGYEVTEGEVLYKGGDILDLEPEERSHIGLFLAFQYPIEIPGVSNEDFLRVAYNSKREYYGEPPVDPLEFMLVCTQKLSQVKMDAKFLSRNVNEGFSGGEKKRNEILQMVLLDSQLSILDETDSGLDIDALKIVAKGINNFRDSDNSKSVILITHYQRLLDYVKPDFVHVMYEGKIVKTGDASLAKELEENGYGWLEEIKK